ncbi:hypothetical protein [Geomicrobium sp. JCM 19039]|uniref:hypothetical protein n=1 Tax=Geomicrobium sp. JCM 19039 TaxID=1460636 RepID=UPI00045F1662|nr:hypothetical protein [Geomicrobium sp. JCM 19039]GAK14106.1 hypothetical protein JCM19039_4003 [Geomicrobium sp. JCM 19039]
MRNHSLNIVPVPTQFHVPINEDAEPLSVATQQQVDAYWQRVNADGKFFRGELFIIDSIHHTNDELVIAMKASDYAHHLYAKSSTLPPQEACTILAPAALIRTKDNYLIFGRMGEHTAKPRMIQCVGGGIDDADVVNGEIDLVGNVQREVLEEVGLSTQMMEHVTSIGPLCLVYPEAYVWVAVIYEINIPMRKDEFVSFFEAHQMRLRRLVMSPN